MKIFSLTYYVLIFLLFPGVLVNYQDIQEILFLLCFYVCLSYFVTRERATHRMSFKVSMIVERKEESCHDWKPSPTKCLQPGEFVKKAPKHKLLHLPWQWLTFN